MNLVYEVKAASESAPAANPLRSRDRRSGVHGRKRGKGWSYQLCSVIPNAVVLFLISVHGIAATVPVRITLGHSVVDLNGPWKFHVGDDATWADPNFDDSNWESV